MAKFFGNIGFQMQAETRPGIFQPVVTERPYYGDVLRCHTRWNTVSDKVNDDINLSNEISVIADPFALNNFSTAIYIVYMGQRFKISGIEVLYPRLKISMGEVYNGPTAENAESPCGCN